MREIINELITKAIADNNEPVRKAMIELRERLPKQPSEELTQRMLAAQTRRIASLEASIDSMLPTFDALEIVKVLEDESPKATVARIIAERNAARTERDEFEAAYQALLAKHEPIVKALHRYHLAEDEFQSDVNAFHLVMDIESILGSCIQGTAAAKEETRHATA